MALGHVLVVLFYSAIHREYNQYKMYYSSSKAIISGSTLNQWAMDFTHNGSNIMDSVERSIREGSRLRMGAELEVCGYSCEDHFLEEDTLTHCWEVCRDILKKDYRDIIVCIGMPVMV